MYVSINMVLAWCLCNWIELQ